VNATDELEMIHLRPEASRLERFNSFIRAEKLLIWTVILLVIVLVFLPMVFLVLSALNVGDTSSTRVTQFGLDNFARVFRNLDWWYNTFVVAILGTALAIVIGVTLSWIINRTTVPWQGFLEQSVLIPFYMTPLLGAIAWSILGSERSGLINRLFMSVFHTQTPLINTHSLLGIVFVVAIYESCVAFMMISAAMKSMDPSLEESSLMLGAGKFATARRITIPLTLPAVGGAALFIFAGTMGTFAVPAVLGVNAGVFVITTKIYTVVNRFPPDYALAAALGLALAAITGVAVAMYGKQMAANSYTTITGKSFRPRRMNMGSWTPVLFGICLLYVLVAMVIPLGVLVYTSFLVTPTTDPQQIHWTLDNYEHAFVKLPIARIALQTSFVLGILTATIGVVFMGLISWIMYRSKMRGTKLLEYVAMFPQAVPGVVFSLGLLWAWLVIPVGMYGTIWILLLCYLTVFLPLGVRTMTGVIMQLEPSLEECSRMCGASWLRTLWSVTVPLLKPGVLATWMLLFIVSLREVSASVLLVSAENKVIGPTLLNFYETALPPVTAVAVVMAGVIFVGMLAAAMVSRWVGASCRD